MKPLAREFKYDQFNFRQLAREGDVALFEKSKAGHTSPSYEVVLVQHHPAETIHGRRYPERESMPPSESWGILGFSPADLESAEAKFRDLVNRAKANSPPTPFPADASEHKGPLPDGIPVAFCRSGGKGVTVHSQGRKEHPGVNGVAGVARSTDERCGDLARQVRTFVAATVSGGPGSMFQVWDGHAFHQNAFQVFYGGDQPEVEFIELSRGSAVRALYRDLDVFATPTL